MLYFAQFPSLMYLAFHAMVCLAVCLFFWQIPDDLTLQWWLQSVLTEQSQAFLLRSRKWHVEHSTCLQIDFESCQHPRRIRCQIGGHREFLRMQTILIKFLLFSQFSRLSAAAGWHSFFAFSRNIWTKRLSMCWSILVMDRSPLKA